MVVGFLILLVCQLLGELLVTWLDVPVPGSVVGMVILFFVLLLLQEVPAGLRQVSEGLLKVLPLLLVPAGVGIMQYFELLQSAWVELLLALVASTLVTLLVVSLILKWMLPEQEEAE